MKTALVLGAGGFIGSHMVKRLRADGYWVRGVDLKYTRVFRNRSKRICLYGSYRQRGHAKSYSLWW